MVSSEQYWRDLGTTSAVVAMFLYEGFAYNVVFLRRILPAVGKEQLVLPFSICFNVAFGMAVWSYVRARASDPGKVPQAWQEFVSSVGDQLPIAPPRLEWQPGKATYCNLCGVPRPERAHHCRVCGFCILRMDHHCPWLGNCVGFKNHKFFLLAVAYSVLSSAIALGTTFPEFIFCCRHVVRWQEESTKFRYQLYYADLWILVIFSTLALLLAPVLGAMFAAHFGLIRSNKTSIEGHFEKAPNPFDQGSTTANVAQIFGEFGIDWAVPIQPLRPLSDGLSYERTDEIAPMLSERLLDRDVPPEIVWRSRYKVPPLPYEPESELQDVAIETFSLKSWWGDSSRYACADKRCLMKSRGAPEQPPCVTCSRSTLNKRVVSL